MSRAAQQSGLGVQTVAFKARRRTATAIGPRGPAALWCLQQQGQLPRPCQVQYSTDCPEACPEVLTFASVVSVLLLQLIRTNASPAYASTLNYQLKQQIDAAAASAAATGGPLTMTAMLQLLLPLLSEAAAAAVQVGLAPLQVAATGPRALGAARSSALAEHTTFINSVGGTPLCLGHLNQRQQQQQQQPAHPIPTLLVAPLSVGDTPTTCQHFPRATYHTCPVGSGRAQSVPSSVQQQQQQSDEVVDVLPASPFARPIIIPGAPHASSAGSSLPSTGGAASEQPETGRRFGSSPLVAMSSLLSTPGVAAPSITCRMLSSSGSVVPHQLPLTAAPAMGPTHAVGRLMPGQALLHPSVTLGLPQYSVTGSNCS